ncbi:uncharacterized protein LOC144702169 [Wolffia australiana]
MVFNYENSFVGDLFYQVNISSQQASYVETPAFQVLPEKQLNISDEEVKVFASSLGNDNPHCEAVTELSVAAQNCRYESLHGSHDHVRFEHIFDLGYEKRSHPGDDLQENPTKRAKNSDLVNQIQATSFEQSPIINAHAEPLPSEGALRDGSSYEEPSGDVSGSTSNLSWVSCNTSEEVCHSSPQINAEYVSNLDYYPRKHVVLGPNHQAAIPEWRPRPTKKPKDEEIREQRLMGTLITPASSSLPDPIACGCGDGGSIGCVRQHVMEAREGIKRIIGPAQFVDLGFPDMGEAVALRWAEEERQVFHEVVAENPASAGKNFWAQLRKFLPCKTSKELVSYYYNVFILRKRAEQNRSDPSNIDSDNDEWQSTEEEEEEGSEYVSDEEDDYDSAVKAGEFLLRDDSCTSFEGQGHVAGREQRSRGVAINAVVDSGFLMSPEGNPWELGLFSGLEKTVDFLPTCHVIEEVFGEGSWAGSGSDGGEGII